LIKANDTDTVATFDLSTYANLCIMEDRTQTLWLVLENAIWHGISPLDRKGTITVHFEKSGNRIICSVTDNGVGRKASEQAKKGTQKKHQSVGISITERRLKLFNSYYKSNVFLETKDLEDGNGIGTGTQVQLSFPANLPPPEKS